MRFRNSIVIHCTHGSAHLSRMLKLCLSNVYVKTVFFAVTCKHML